MKSELTKKLYLFDSYNSLVDNFLNIYNKKYVETIYDDVKKIEKIKVNYKKYFIPFFNFILLKKDMNFNVNNFSNKDFIEYIFWNFYLLLRRYNIFFIFALLIIIIPIICVWLLLADDLMIIKIFVTCLTPLLIIAMFFQAIQMFHNFIKFNRFTNSSDLYLQELRRICYSCYIINFKYFYRRNKVGIGILEKNNLILTLNNGNEYKFDNFIDLIKKMHEIDRNLLYLKNDDKLYKNKNRFLTLKFFVEKIRDQEFLDEQKKFCGKRRIDFVNFENYVVFSNEHKIDFEKITKWAQEH